MNKDNMVTGSLDERITELYDRMHEFYVDSFKFNNVYPPTEQCIENMDKLHSIMNSVNFCMVQIAFGNMNSIDFFDNVNLNELYVKVFLITCEIQNVTVNEGCDYMIDLQNKIRQDADAICNAIDAVIQFFKSVML